MTHLPEIDPELRGLLEEIVADPRSTIRIVPRRALRNWFDTDETIRPRDVSGTRAERHLIEAHREELAAVLCEASRLAYFKAPVLTQRFTGSQGSLCSLGEAEARWRASTKGALSSSGSISGIELLRQSVTELRPQDALPLAMASLAIVPSELARAYLALAIPWAHPRTAIAIFKRLASRCSPSLRQSEVLLSLAARLCSVERLEEAKSSYEMSARLAPDDPHPLMYSFNLSCFLGDEKRAIAEAERLDHLLAIEDPRLVDVASILGEWCRSRPPRSLAVARMTKDRISSAIPRVAVALTEAFNR